MSQFHDTELQQSVTAELMDEEPVSTEKRNRSWARRIRYGTHKKNVVRTIVLAVVATGILAPAGSSLLSKRGPLLTELPVSVRPQPQPVNTARAVLAVDTLGLTIRGRNVSASTRELFEQGTVEHLARLHRTYSSWADKDGELMGALFLKLTVGARGTVVRVNPLSSHVTDANFTKTVMADIRNWKFPIGGVEAAEITVALLFVPKGMDSDTVVQWERKIRNAREKETSTARLPFVNKLPISVLSKHTPKSFPSVSSSDHTNTTESSTVHFPIAKTEEEMLAAFKTNRPVAVRENPRFSSKNLQEVEGDTRLSILEKRGDWLKVRIGDAGFIGFVRKEFVSPIN